MHRLTFTGQARLEHNANGENLFVLPCLLLSYARTGIKINLFIKFLQIYVLTIRGEVQDWNNPEEENQTQKYQGIEEETTKL